MEKKYSWSHPLRRLMMLRFPYEHKTDFYARIGVSRGFMSRLSNTPDTGVTVKTWQEILEKAGVKNPVLIQWLLFGGEPSKNILRLLRKYHGKITDIPDINYEIFVSRLNHFRLEDESKNSFIIRLGVPAHVWEQWEFSHTKEISPSEVKRICDVIGIDYRSPEGVWLMFSSKNPPPKTVNN